MDIPRLKKRILNRIRSCYYEIPQPRHFLTEEEFFYRSTSRWAVKELENAVYNSQDNPYKVISLFIKKMDKFALKAKTDNQKQIFSIGYDIAIWVEDMVLADVVERR